MNGEKYLDVKHLTKVLPWSKSAIYRMCNERVIPHYRRRGKIIFLLSEVEDWLKEGQVRLEGNQFINPVKSQSND